MIIKVTPTEGGNHFLYHSNERWWSIPSLSYSHELSVSHRLVSSTSLLKSFLLILCDKPIDWFWFSSDYILIIMSRGKRSFTIIIFTTRSPIIDHQKQSRSLQSSWSLSRHYTSSISGYWLYLYLHIASPPTNNNQPTNGLCTVNKWFFSSGERHEKTFKRGKRSCSLSAFPSRGSIPELSVVVITGLYGCLLACLPLIWAPRAPTNQTKPERTHLAFDFY